ncbi:MAG: FAD-dependent oxidoreductase, partial [Calditrichaeota bacterium]
MTSDVIIIGGGIIGLCCAYYLQQSGCRVIVLEKEQIGSGCSHGNAGLITPSHFVPLASPGTIGKGLRWLLDPESPFYLRPRMDRELWRWLWRFLQASNVRLMRRNMPVLLRLALASRRLYGELIPAENIACHFQENGMLLVYSGPEGRESCREMMDYAQVLGLPAEWVNSGELSSMEAGYAFRASGAVYFPRDAHLSPADFMAGLARRLTARGVEIHPDTAVQELEVSGGKVVRVRTAKGGFSGNTVVLAAGAWSPLLLKSLGIRLPLQPAKGYSITRPLDHPPPRIPLILEEAKVAVTPMGDVIRLAGTLELSGWELSIRPRRVRAIIESTAAYVKGFPLQEWGKLPAWSGLRPCSPDGLPFIGPFSTPSNLI